MESVKEYYPFIAVGAILIILFIVLLFFLKSYIKCPPDKALIIFGKMPEGNEGSVKIIVGGSAFIWPVIQDYGFLNLAPLRVRLNIKGKIFLQEVRIDVPSEYKVAISSEPGLMNVASERLFGYSDEKIILICENIISHKLKTVIMDLGTQAINNNSNLLDDTLQDRINMELSKLGMELLSMN